MARNDDGSEFAELSVIFPFFDEGENTIFVRRIELRMCIWAAGVKKFMHGVYLSLSWM